MYQKNFLLLFISISSFVQGKIAPDGLTVDVVQKIFQSAASLRLGADLNNNGIQDFYGSRRCDSLVFNGVDPCPNLCAFGFGFCDTDGSCFCPCFGGQPNYINPIYTALNKRKMEELAEMSKGFTIRRKRQPMMSNSTAIVNRQPTSLQRQIFSQWCQRQFPQASIFDNTSDGSLCLGYCNQYCGLSETYLCGINPGCILCVCVCKIPSGPNGKKPNDQLYIQH